MKTFGSRFAPFAGEDDDIAQWLDEADSVWETFVEARGNRMSAQEREHEARRERDDGGFHALIELKRCARTLADLDEETRGRLKRELETTGNSAIFQMAVAARRTALAARRPVAPTRTVGPLSKGGLFSRMAEAPKPTQAMSTDLLAAIEGRLHELTTAYEAARSQVDAFHAAEARLRDPHGYRARERPVVERRRPHA